MRDFRMRPVVGALLFSIIGMVWVHHPVDANEGKATLAAPVVVEGTVRDGDIVSYHATDETYRASAQAFDPAIFGVVVDDPLLYMEEQGAASGTRPIVRYGEALVNVSNIAGPVRPGDLVTTSRIVGVGQRAERETSGYVLGFAVGTMEYGPNTETLSIDGVEVRVGTVPVALQMGYFNADNEIVEEDDEEDGVEVVAAVTEEEEGNGFDVFLLFRYLLGSFVALTAVILALRRFGDLFAQSIVSVGRNPLARSQIRSILVWNAVLIVIVSGVGLGIGVAIIVM